MMSFIVSVTAVLLEFSFRDKIQGKLILDILCIF